MRRAWVGFVSALALNVAAGAVALAARGPWAQALGVAVFVSSIPLLWLATRLLDHYEGPGHEVSRVGQAIRYGAYALASSWALAELALGPGMEEATLKMLVFLCLFLNAWSVFGVFLELDKGRR